VSHCGRLLCALRVEADRRDRLPLPQKYAHICRTKEKPRPLQWPGLLLLSARGMQDQKQGVWPICSDLYMYIIGINTNNCFSAADGRN